MEHPPRDCTPLNLGILFEHIIRLSLIRFIYLFLQFIFIIFCPSDITVSSILISYQLFFSIYCQIILEA